MRRTAVVKVYSGILNGLQFWEGGRWHTFEDDYFGFGPFYYDNKTDSELRDFYTQEIIDWLGSYGGRRQGFTFSVQWDSETTGVIINETTGERYWFRIEVIIHQ